VAVKQLLMSKMNEKELRSFTGEAKLLSSLRPHSNIVLYVIGAVKKCLTWIFPLDFKEFAVLWMSHFVLLQSFLPEEI
jgi:hypothetical protein